MSRRKSCWPTGCKACKYARQGQTFEVKLALLGLHNVRNALAAIASALAAGVEVAAIQAGLAAFRPVKGRLQAKRTPAGVVVVDDTYNANPDSMRAAIDVLAGFSAPRLLILGDMGEVGDQGPAFHAEIGAYARARGIEALWATGEAAPHAVAAFGVGARHFRRARRLDRGAAGSGRSDGCRRHPGQRLALHADGKGWSTHW